MQFGPVPPAAAEGAILAHATGAPLHFRKGRLISAADIAALKEAGFATVTVARLEQGDVPEDQAAARVARALAGGAGIRVGAAFTGRANLYAEQAGLLALDAPRIDAINRLDEAVTVATLSPFARVAPRQMLATVKIIPFAAPERTVAAIEAMAPSLRLAPFRPHRAALISTRLPGTKPALLDKNRTAMEARLGGLGSSLVFERRVDHTVAPLAEAIAEAAASGADPILVFGASAISDRRDVIPAAIEAAGGTVELFGMPVDPGNLLLLGHLGSSPPRARRRTGAGDARSSACDAEGKGGRVVGLPGCARSPKQNGFDFVLWRLLAGLAVGRAEIAAMGVGGLLTEIASRPQPREQNAPRLPHVGAVVLAAGRSSRMGRNKLLEPVAGKPMVRHAVEAALASAADPVLVVTGNESEKIRAALEDLPVHYLENRDFSKGLSSSLICGLNGLPQDSEGGLILLGDMPGVDAALIDRLIAAFSPEDGRSVIVPVWAGRRGNPVLWGREFFPAIRGLSGDQGARGLLAGAEDRLCEVASENDAPLADIDTEAALASFQSHASRSEAMGE